MADQGMLSLFGEDGNLFSDSLEGLGECDYNENAVNPMGQQMSMDQGYVSLQSPLHHTPTNPNPTKLSHFDHYNQYEQQKMHLMDQPPRMLNNAPGNGVASPHSQYHNSPVPHGGGQMGVYPGIHNERHAQPFVDGGAMWAPRAVQMPDQIRAPYQHQQQHPQTPAASVPAGPGHTPHIQPLGNFLTRDFSVQQHGPPQPQRINQFSQGPDGMNRGNPFLGASAPGHLPHVSQQNPNMGPSLRHSVQQFHHHPPSHHVEPVHSPRYSPNPHQGTVRQQTINFNSRSPTVPSPTLNSGQYSRCPYSNLNQGLVNSTGMNPNLGLTNNTPMNPSIPRYPNAAGFPPNGSQGLIHQQSIHPSGSINQMNTQTMHPSQPQGTYSSPPPMSPLKAMSNPTGTPPPQVRPGSAGIPIDVGSYPNIPHPPPQHQSPGRMGMGPRHMGPRNMQQGQPFLGMSPTQREMGGHMRPNGCSGVGQAPPQALQDRLMAGQLPSQQSFQQQMANCPSMQAHSALHHRSSPPHPHHQPWTQLHLSPQNTPPKVPVHQHSPSDHFLEKSMPDMTRIGRSTTPLMNSEDYLPPMELLQPQQKKKKKKNNHIATGDSMKDFYQEGFDNPDYLVDFTQDGKKKKKKREPKLKKEPKQPKVPKEPKEPKVPKVKEPKAPKTPKIPKEPREKKVKTTTPKPKTSRKSGQREGPDEGRLPPATGRARDCVYWENKGFSCMHSTCLARPKKILLGKLPQRQLHT